MSFRQKKTGGRLLIEFDNEENFFTLNLQEQLLWAAILGTQDDRPEGEIKATQQKQRGSGADGYPETHTRGTARRHAMEAPQEVAV